MEQQFWVVGGDRIHLSIQGKTHVFGKQLELHEAQQLAKVFNQRLAKLQKKHSTPGDRPRHHACKFDVEKMPIPPQ